MFFAPFEAEGCEEHDAGVVDEDVDRAEFLTDAFGGGDDRVAVGDVGLDRDCAVAEFVGEGVDPVAAAGEQCDPVAVGVQCAGCRFADAGGGAGDHRHAAGALIGAHGVQLPLRAGSGSSTASDDDSAR